MNRSAELGEESVTGLIATFHAGSISQMGRVIIQATQEFDKMIVKIKNNLTTANTSKVTLDNLMNLSISNDQIAEMESTHNIGLHLTELAESLYKTFKQLDIK